MRYLLFNKPYGVLTQFTDTAARSDSPRMTLKPFIDVPDVYPVGRLDRDSEGLLLLTDDGRLASRLIDPEYGHERTYWAQVEGVPTSDAIQRLQQGVLIKGYTTRPATVRAITEPTLPERAVPIRYRKSIPTAWLELCLTEGKNRQVRRMTAAVGFPTLRLVRSQLAFLTLEGLDVGQWRDLTPKELQALVSLTGRGFNDRSSLTGRAGGKGRKPFRRNRARRSKRSSKRSPNS